MRIAFWVNSGYVFLVSLLYLGNLVFGIPERLFSSPNGAYISYILFLCLGVLGISAFVGEWKYKQFAGGLKVYWWVPHLIIARLGPIALAKASGAMALPFVFFALGGIHFEIGAGWYLGSDADATEVLWLAVNLVAVAGLGLSIRQHFHLEKVLALSTQEPSAGTTEKEIPKMDVSAL
ncbi:MAG: hypothetical protein H6510_15005 [Acidobacteria bacterium]|nr:hypothetical protein [Acidobacteriota bacterium]